MPAREGDGAGQGDRRDRVGEGRQGLAGEDLVALDRAGEDRLQGLVAVLGGDDVTRRPER